MVKPLNTGTLCADSLIEIKEILGGKGENISANPENANIQEITVWKRKLILQQDLWMKGCLKLSWLIEGSTSNECQEENELTPKDKAKVTVLNLKPGKSVNFC